MKSFHLLIPVSLSHLLYILHWRFVFVVYWKFLGAASSPGFPAGGTCWAENRGDPRGAQGMEQLPQARLDRAWNDLGQCKVSLAALRSLHSPVLWFDVCTSQLNLQKMQTQS